MRRAGRNDVKLSMKAQLQITDAGMFLTLQTNYTNHLKNHTSARLFSAAVIVNTHRFINNSS